MCGIFGYIGKDNKAIEITFRGLEKLEYRGYDSWGLVGIKSIPLKRGLIFLKKEIGKISEARLNFFPPSKIALGHTRWATHGGVKKKNSHPHFDCQKNIFVVHNGIIENYQELKKRLIAKGHHFVSETDTEVIAHLIEEYKNKISFFEASKRAFSQIKGLNAFAVLGVKEKKIVIFKNGSPLVIGKRKDGYFISSDALALLPFSPWVYFLEDGEMVLLNEKEIKLFGFNFKKEKKIRWQKLDWKIEEGERGNYPHFMIKEIKEQPMVLRRIVNYEEKEIKKKAKLIKNAFGAYLIGCGTAAYACLWGTYIFSKLAHFHINFSVGSEFGYLIDFLTPKSLVIALSQSGETADILESVKKAKEKRAKVLAIVNVFGSSLYRLADEKLLLKAGPEKCVLATKSFTAKLAILYLLAQTINNNLDKGKKQLLKTILTIEKIFQPFYLRKIKRLAKKLKDKEHIYIIGRGPSYPIALEAALKMKEVSYIHAEGFAGGELKHGVIALIEKGTPCIVFAPNDETYGAVLSGAMEMKARGAFIIGVSFKNHEIFDYFFPVNDCRFLSSIANIIVAQLLAYHLCLEKGFDPDKPRNLAKSVTVK